MTYHWILSSDSLSAFISHQLHRILHDTYLFSGLSIFHRMFCSSRPSGRWTARSDGWRSLLSPTEHMRWRTLDGMIGLRMARSDSGRRSWWKTLKFCAWSVVLLYPNLYFAGESNFICISKFSMYFEDCFSFSQRMFLHLMRSSLNSATSMLHEMGSLLVMSLASFSPSLPFPCFLFHLLLLLLPLRIKLEIRNYWICNLKSEF